MLGLQVCMSLPILNAFTFWDPIYFECHQWDPRTLLSPRDCLLLHISMSVTLGLVACKAGILHFTGSTGAVYRSPEYVGWRYFFFPEKVDKTRVEEASGSVQKVKVSMLSVGAGG